jgi:tetratricopeptide (TPR) repeat protein
MAKSKKISNVQKTAAAPPTNLNVEHMKPKMGILLGSCFGLLILILVTHLYSMTSQYVFSDTLNYAAVNNFKDKSSFWMKLLYSGITAPLSQPWLRSTYAWDISSFGFEPGWSHAVNICLHVLSCIYFYVFTFHISWRLNVENKTKIDPYYVAAAATALLACHPLVTGSIAYVSGRSGVLGAANYFLALNFFLYAFYESKFWRACLGYLLFFLFTAIGILSNIQCLTIPLVALALVCLLKPPVVSIKEWFADRVYDIALLIIMGVSFGYLIRFGLPAQIDSGYGLPVLAPPIYWATQAKMVIMYYLRCALAPIGLGVYPPYVASGWSDPGAIFGAVAVATLGVVGLVKKQPQVQIATVIFLLNLLPWAVLAQSEIAADSRFYLSLSGLCLAAGVGIAHLAAKDLRKTAIGFAILLVAMVSLSIVRETDWSTNQKLWRTEIKQVPGNARAHAYLGAELLDDKKTTAAAKNEIDQALKLNPDDFVAHVVNGYYYLKQEDNAHAKQEFQKAIEVGAKLKMSDEELAPCHAQLMRSYYLDNNLPAAFKEATLVHGFITNDSILNLVIGKKELADHMPTLALKTFEDGVKLDPTNAEFLVPIAQAALDTGLPQVMQHAYAASRRAVQVRPSLLSSKLYIRSCLEFGRPEEARGRLEMLRKTDPKDAELIWLSYGYAKQSGKTVEAEKLRKEALSLEPSLEKRVKFGLNGSNALHPVVPAVVLPPTQSAPVNPSTLKPASVDSAPANPSTVKPAPVDSAPANPSTVKPAPVDSAPANPSTVKPAPLNPASANPSTEHPPSGHVSSPH